MKTFRNLAAFGSAFLIVAALPRAGAQTPSASTAPTQLAPVVVTADLWETPLATIPASVSVIEAGTLARQGVTHFGDVADAIPNLTWTGGTSRPRHLQLRGLGENSQYEGETPDSAVRFLVDDLDFTALGALGGTFDLQQIEVLRGPQAGAFGAHAAGGVVRLVTAAPTAFWSGRVEAGLGENGLRRGALAFGGPLVETRPEELTFRVALQRQDDDGFRRNLTLKRATNARDEIDGRLRMRWITGGEWQWDVTAVGGRQRNGFDEFALDNNGRFTFSDQPGVDNQDVAGASLRGSGAVGAHTRLTSITTAMRVESRYSYDDDWTAASYAGFSDLERTRRAWTQEVRLDGEDGAGFFERWTVGAFASRGEEDGAYRNTDPGNIRGLVTAYQAEHYTLFGQGSRALGDATRLTLGLRGERIDLTGTGRRTRFRASRNAFDPEVNIAPAFADTTVGGKLTLEQAVAERWQVFASVARGYKAGGINLDARINPLVDPLTYGTEHLWNYEVGVRGFSADERLRGGVTVFHFTRHDTQVRDSAGFGGSYRFFTDNADSAEHSGLEAEGAWQVAQDWTVRGSLALLRGSIDEFVLSNGNVGGGRRLANTPSHGYSLGVAYAPARGLFVSADLVGRAAFYESNNHDERRSAFTVVNASVGYAWGAWSVSAWARNVFDARYEKRVFFFGNDEALDYAEQRYTSRADPRQLGLSARWEF